jgi:DNA-binding XRE family transcriptional regulator
VAASVNVDGTRIEHLRKTRAGLNRTEAAAALDISATALYMIERHPQRTRPQTLKRIAALLGERPEDLAVPTTIAS